MKKVSSIAALISAFVIPHSSFSQNKPISVGEPDADVSPAGELATFKVLDGFEVNLFASEADGVSNPLVIRWDEKGRLWCVCPLSYPQPVPGQPLEDKILILEDTDGDGRADKKTVFADGLRMPTGLELAPAKSPKGHSVYVGEGEKLLLLHDLDGDDKMDEREVVFSGFGTGDTHQSINSFIWSPDGSLVMHQGLHCYSRVTTAWGVKTLYGAGFWHYRPRSGKLEAYPTGMPLNAWGTVFTDEGQPIMIAGAAGMYWARPMEVSTSDTNVGGNAGAKDGQVHGIPHFLLERFQLPYGGQILKTEGLRKFCGIDLAGNSHWPKDMQGEIICGGFFENAVFRYKLENDKEFPSGMVAIEQAPLLTSSSIAFRPVDIRFGPEGALYIADWYDPIIGHYQASFRHPNRDMKHGRIWRVVAKGKPAAKAKMLTKRSFAESTLADLAEKSRGDGRDQTDALQDLVAYAFGSDRWTSYQSQRLLRAASAQEAIQAAAWGLASHDAITPKLSPNASEEQKRAVLQALRGLKDFQNQETHKIWQASTWFDQPINASHYVSMETADADHIRASFTHGLGTFADQIPDALKLIEERTSDNSPRVRLEAVVAAAKVKSPDAIRVALKVLDKPMDSFIERALWLAVHATEKQWQPLTVDFLKPMAPEHIAFLIKRHGSKEVRETASHLLKQDGLPDSVKEGLTLALAKEEQNNDGLTKEDRLRLFNVAADAEKLVALAKQTTASMKPRSAALTKLVSVDAARAGKLAAAQLNSFSELDAMRQWLAPILPVSAATKAMTAALKEKAPTADAGKLVIRVLTSTGRNDPELTAALGQTTTVQPYDAAWVNTLAAEVKAKGDPEKGKAVFASTLTNCTACHAIAKKGGTIGPELDAVGRGIPIELLIEAVAFPNRQIKEGYVATTVTTKDGRVMQGYKISDANGELQLRDLLGGTIHKFQAAQLTSRTEAGSLMPEGLIGLMTREELRDLVAYLTTLGR